MFTCQEMRLKLTFPTSGGPLQAEMSGDERGFNSVHE